MAEINPLGYQEMRTKAINKINSDTPRCINDINNIINKAAGEGKFSAIISLDQNGFSVLTVQNAINKFDAAGYEIVTQDNRKVKISWELEK